MKKFIIPLVLGLILTAPGLSSGSESQDLARYFDQEIGQIQEAMEQTEDSPATACAEADEDWYLSRFWIRVRPRIAFKVPGFAKLEIVPETELLWQRDFPEGWVGYHP